MDSFAHGSSSPRAIPLAPGETDWCLQIKTFSLFQTPLQTHSLSTLIGAVRSASLIRGGGRSANKIAFQLTAAALKALRNRDQLL